MWPLGSTLRSFSTELRVPGQDSLYSIVGNAGWPLTAYAGIYFNKSGGPSPGFAAVPNDGYIAQRNTIGYFTISSPPSQVGDGVWIADDFKQYVDPSLYEFRFIEVTGDTAFLSGRPWYAPGTYNSETGWQSGETDPYWLLQASGPQFGTMINVVDGIISVREKANHSNIRTGSLQLTAWYEGES
jgi:hypothetical protein